MKHFKLSSEQRQNLLRGIDQDVKDENGNIIHSFKANNPFMIYCATDNIDPDVDINGYRQTDTPTTRQFLFGLNFSF